MVSFEIYFKGTCNSLSSMFWDYYIWITAQDFGTYCIFANPSNTRMLCDFLSISRTSLYLCRQAVKAWQVTMSYAAVLADSISTEISNMVYIKVDTDAWAIFFFGKINFL